MDEEKRINITAKTPYSETIRILRETRGPEGQENCDECELCELYEECKSCKRDKPQGHNPAGYIKPINIMLGITVVVALLFPPITKLSIWIALISAAMIPFLNWMVRRSS